MGNAIIISMVNSSFHTEPSKLFFVISGWRSCYARTQSSVYSPSRRSTRPRSLTRASCTARRAEVLSGRANALSPSASATSSSSSSSRARSRSSTTPATSRSGHRPPPGPVHRRRLAPDRQPGGRQRRRPRRLRGLRGLGARPCGSVLNQCPDLSDIILQAFIARRQLLRESAGLHRPAGDRLALLARTRSGSATSWPGTACCSPGWTWRPTRRWTGCSSSSA